MVVNSDRPFWRPLATLPRRESSPRCAAQGRGCARFVAALALAWPGAALTSQDAAGAGSAHGQTTPELQHAFAITSRSEIGVSFSMIAGTLTMPTILTESVEPAKTFVIKNLDPSFSLINANGRTADGSPFIDVSASSRAGLQVPLALYLTFKVPRSAALATTLSFSVRQLLVRPQAAPSASDLLGADLEGDGIRDDLEPIIQARYRDRPKMLAAAKQQLRAMRVGLAATQGPTYAFDATLVLIRSLKCILEVVGHEKGEKEANFLRDATLNTKDRVRAWIASGDLLAGQVVPTSAPNPCDG